MKWVSSKCFGLVFPLLWVCCQEVSLRDEALVSHRGSLPKGAYFRLGNDPWHLGAAVRSVVFVNQDQFVCAGDRLWIGSLSGKETLRPFGGDSRRLRAISVSRNGRKLVTGCEDGFLVVWDIETEKPDIKIQAHEGNILGVAINEDGSVLWSVGEDGRTQCFDARNGKKLWMKSDSRPMCAIAVSADGSQVFTGGKDLNIHVLQSSTGERIRKFKAHLKFLPVEALSVCGNTNRIFSVYPNGCGLWTPEGNPVFEVEVDYQRFAAYSPNGKLFATLWGAESITVWDASTGQEIRQFESEVPLAYHLAFSPDSRFLVVAGMQGRVNILDVETARWADSGSGIERVLMPPAIHPKGSLLVYLGADNTPVVLDLKTMARTKMRCPEEPVTDLMLRPDGKVVFGFTRGGTILAWDLEHGSILWQTKIHHGFIRSASISFLGTQMVTAGFDQKIILTDLEKGNLVRIVATLHKEPNYHDLKVNFTPDDQRIIAVIQRHLIEEFYIKGEAANAKTVELEKGIKQICYSQVGDLMAVVTEDGEIQIWDAEYSPYQVLETLTLSERYSSVAISPDGAYLLAGGDSGTLSLWDLKSRSWIKTFAGHQAAVDAVGFFAGGTRAFSYSADGTTFLWTIGADDDLGAADRSRQLDFNPAESALSSLRNDLRSLDVDRWTRAWNVLSKLKPSTIERLWDSWRGVDVALPCEEDIEEMLSDLDHDVPEIRERARRKFKGYGRIMLDWIRANSNPGRRSHEVEWSLRILESELTRAPFVITDVGLVRFILYLESQMPSELALRLLTERAQQPRGFWATQIAQRAISVPSVNRK